MEIMNQNFKPTYNACDENSPRKTKSSETIRRQNFFINLAIKNTD